MNIETYEVEEIEGELGQMAADSESADLIAKLDLVGQRQLLNAETCTRFPYRLMTKVEYHVFHRLFQERTPLHEYRDGIIPLRVLQVASFAKENAPLEMKAGLYVWHCGRAKEDPLLVGHTSEYGGEFYLLARWGDSLLPFTDLVTKAQAIWKSMAKTKIREDMMKLRSQEENLDSLATELFTTGAIKGDYTLRDV